MDIEKSHIIAFSIFLFQLYYHSCCMSAEHFDCTDNQKLLTTLQCCNGGPTASLAISDRRSIPTLEDLVVGWVGAVIYIGQPYRL